jgi:hypothetical protein
MFRKSQTFKSLVRLLAQLPRRRKRALMRLIPLAILAGVADPQAWLPPPSRLSSLLEACSEPVLQERWHAALEAIDAHWTHLLREGASPLRSPSLLALRIDQWRRRFSAVWRSMN